MTKSDKDEVKKNPGNDKAQNDTGSPLDVDAMGESNDSSVADIAAEVNAAFADAAAKPTAGVVDSGGEAGGESGASGNGEGLEGLDPEAIMAAAAVELQEWKDKYMRLHAEWDTYRRRMADQRATEKASATEKLVEHLLPVIDDFERTIDYADKNGEAGLLDGIHAVHSKLIAALEKEGVEVLNPQGEAFDALECQAVATCEETSVPDETVAEVFQKGYKMGIKVLRPAMVTVTTGGPKREVPQENEDK